MASAGWAYSVGQALFLTAGNSIGPEVATYDKKHININQKDTLHGH